MIIKWTNKEMGKEMWEKEENEIKVSKVCRSGGRCYGMKTRKTLFSPSD
jgi:hypothetical protein